MRSVKLMVDDGVAQMSDNTILRNILHSLARSLAHSLTHSLTHFNQLDGTLEAPIVNVQMFHPSLLTTCH